MSKLIENILSGDLLAASEMFEAHVSDIMEKKLYEKKRMMQAEVFGGLSKDQIDARKKAGWMKASIENPTHSSSRRYGCWNTVCSSAATPPHAETPCAAFPCPHRLLYSLSAQKHPRCHRQ